jgi:hypothetical protein
VRTPGAKIRLERFCVRRQPTYQPTGALDGDEVIIDTLKVTPNRYPYIRTVSSSGEENKILSVVNAYDFSHDLRLLRRKMKQLQSHCSFVGQAANSCLESHGLQTAICEASIILCFQLT